MEKRNTIVLVEPEIPYNTGNIARSCVITNTRLHLIRPLGFVLSDHYIKRSGMDYWEDVDLTVWDDWADFEPYMVQEAKKGTQILYATTHGGKTLKDLTIQSDTMILFGKESAGLPKELLKNDPDRCYRIPMFPGKRSLNLSNAQAIFLYEVLRQQGYPGLC